MKKHCKSIAAVFMLVLFVGRSNAQNMRVEKLDDGMLMHLAGTSPKAIRLQVVTDKIIHVTVSSVDPIHRDTTLMVVAPQTKPRWSVKTNSQQTVLSTGTIKAIVDQSSGVVQFTDISGKPILQQEKNSSLFTPVTIETGASWQIKQTFLSSANEAFYGLGQHQQGIMNYKGEVVELLQTNTEVAIPFLVSSKNYGLLWDNYSITHFGDGRNYQPLNQLKLFNEAGKSGGLTTKYISNKKEDADIVREESGIDYNFLSSLANVPAKFSLNDGRVTWQGSIQSPFTGLHKFAVKYGGYIKVWVDNNCCLKRGGNAGKLAQQYRLSIFKPGRNIPFE